jgi:hypothetical protein
LLFAAGHGYVAQEFISGAQRVGLNRWAEMTVPVKRGGLHRGPAFFVEKSKAVGEGGAFADENACTGLGKPFTLRQPPRLGANALTWF